ncbi:hypothetical protein [Ectobacillus panaciterrae]|uniref:hypothetical protein n=1 Tax=Ectobacillus panaciterrae TaxID=363872 RepID=UPI0004111E9B|nr:hypothetical protein [Ectobacillus panaciterrae]
MKLKKQDEMEQYQVAKASKNAFIFYTLSLLIWSLYDNLTNHHLGNAFLIMCIGNVVYFASLIIQKRKIDRLEEEIIEGNKIVKFIKRNKYLILGALFIAVLVIIGLIIK